MCDHEDWSRGTFRGFESWVDAQAKSHWSAAIVLQRGVLCGIPGSLKWTSFASPWYHNSNFELQSPLLYGTKQKIKGEPEAASEVSPTW